MKYNLKTFTHFVPSRINRTTLVASGTTFIGPAYDQIISLLLVFYIVNGGTFVCDNQWPVIFKPRHLERGMTSYTARKMNILFYVNFPTKSQLSFAH